MGDFEGKKGKRKWCTYFRITKLKEILLKYPLKKKKKKKNVSPFVFPQDIQFTWGCRWLKVSKYPLNLIHTT